MSTGHLDLLRMVHELWFIAVIVSRQLTICYVCLTFWEGEKFNTCCSYVEFNDADQHGYLPSPASNLHVHLFQLMQICSSITKNRLAPSEIFFKTIIGVLTGESHLGTYVWVWFLDSVSTSRTFEFFKEFTIRAYKFYFVTFCSVIWIYPI